jgi:putative tricarboxylic transport membrane protein
MDVISNLGLGFAVALTLQNIAYCFIGVLLGTIIGVLPGIGPVTTVAMLLPISFTLQPESALILLAGIYYGSTAARPPPSWSTSRARRPRS